MRSQASIRLSKHDIMRPNAGTADSMARTVKMEENYCVEKSELIELLQGD